MASLGELPRIDLTTPCSSDCCSETSSVHTETLFLPSISTPATPPEPSSAQIPAINYNSRNRDKKPKAISLHDSLTLFKQLRVLDKTGTHLYHRFRHLSIPWAVSDTIPLFDDGGTGREWALLTHKNYRPNDHWGPRYINIQGYGNTGTSSDLSDRLCSTTREIVHALDTPGALIEDLPRFILLIGRMCTMPKPHRRHHHLSHRRHSPQWMAPQDQRPLADVSITSYYVVMDVASPRKPLWLIHDAYTRENPADPLPPQQPAEPCGLPFANKVFSIAPLLNSIYSWSDLTMTMGEVKERIETRGRVLTKPLIMGGTWRSRVVKAVRKGYGKE